MVEDELARLRVGGGAMGFESEGGVVAELRARHGRSAQPESQQVLAVLQAVLEVVQAEGLQPSPTALFAAVMSALERKETRSSPQVRRARGRGGGRRRLRRRRRRPAAAAARAAARQSRLHGSLAPAPLLPCGAAGQPRGRRRSQRRDSLTAL
jgi:hypothetical protein